MEPIVLQSKSFDCNSSNLGPIVIGQDHDPNTLQAVQEMWLCYGDRIWFLQKHHVVKLRDFCNAVLAPALDAKAVNPGGETAAEPD